MKETIAQIRYQELLFNFENSEKGSDETLSVKMMPRMESVEGNEDVLALILSVRYQIGEKDVVKYGGVVLFLAEGWKKLEEEKESFDQFKVEIWNRAFGFFRGVLAEKLKGSFLEQMFLPQMPEEDIKEIPLKKI